MDWLKSTGNEGLVIETVNYQTLAAFQKLRLWLDPLCQMKFLKLASQGGTDIPALCIDHQILS